MSLIGTILPYIQLAVAVLLIAAVLMQTRGSSVGGAFGGDNMDTTFYTRRGAELMLFRATIVLGVVFALASFIKLFI